MGRGGWQGGSTSRWRRIRAQVLATNRIEHDGRCQLALAGCTKVANVVHHTLGRAVTGDDPRYLVACCAHCNGRIGDPQVSQPPMRSRSSW